MTLLDSLLNAIVRLEGDALVMHVGEKPYVVTTSAAMGPYRGPLAWGQVELSTRVLTADAVLAILGQILPLEKRQALDDLGAVDHDIDASDGSSDKFIAVAARGGEDVWLELRRKPKVTIVEASASESLSESSAPEEYVATPEPSAVEASEASQFAGDSMDTTEEQPFEIVHEEQQMAPTEADVNALLAASGPALEAAPPIESALSIAHEASHLESLPNAPVEVESEPAPVHQSVGSQEQDIRAETPATPIESSPSPAVPAIFEEQTHVVPESEPFPAPVETPLPEEESSPAAVSSDSIHAPTIATEPVEIVAVRVTHSDDTEPAAEPEMAPVSTVEQAAANVEEPSTIHVAAATSGPADAEFDHESVMAANRNVFEAPADTMVLEERAGEPESAESAGAPPPELEPEPERERAVVVQLARQPIRSESSVSPTAARVDGFSVAELLRVAAARGASTVYVVAQSQPMIRADGEIIVLDIGSGVPLAESDVNRLVLDLAPPSARDAWQRGQSAEWMCDVEDVGRVRWRCLTFREHRGPGLIFRMIPPRAISADQLGLTPEVQALCSQSEGLVLVAGPRASGKSTLMSAFVDLINRTRSDHVVTIESQISFVHESRRSFVSQREVRGDSDAVVATVRAALREDPDVLLIEDLRSAEIASVALEAADSGRLVFGSLPAPSSVAAINRFLELFPSDRRAQAQSSLAGALRGVVSQVLLRRSRGGRVAAREVLLNTPPVAALIEEAKVVQLPLAMESGRRHGMIPLNDALAALVREGTVHVTEAYLKAFDKEGLLNALKREGIDTSFAERLA